MAKTCRPTGFNGNFAMEHRIHAVRTNSHTPATGLEAVEKVLDSIGGGPVREGVFEIILIIRITKEFTGATRRF